MLRMYKSPAWDAVSSDRMLAEIVEKALVSTSPAMIGQKYTLRLCSGLGIEDLRSPVASCRE